MSTPNDPQVDLTSNERAQLERVTEQLVSEFAGVFSPETIEQYLASSREELQKHAKVTMWLPVLAEQLTRDRLRAIARTELGQVDRPAVLFLCTHNAGRSQMAAGWMRQLAGDWVEVFTGGTEPTDALNPAVVQVMNESGIDLSDQLPQPWTDEVALAADAIVTMGCGDACPVFPNTRYEDWDLPSPTGATLDEIRALSDAIKGRVEALLESVTTPVAGGAR